MSACVDTVGELLEDPERHVDVLVMDIDLPEMTGVECLGRLRERGIMIPCVLMTGGFNEPPENTEHMQMIRKPFPMESLQAICSVLLQEYRSALPRREQD